MFIFITLGVTSFIILIFKLHRRTQLTPRSSIHSLKIRMTSHPCSKYEHTTLSYLLSVNYIPAACCKLRYILRFVCKLKVGVLVERCEYELKDKNLHLTRYKFCTVE